MFPENSILPLAGGGFNVETYGSRGFAASHARARRWASASWAASSCPQGCRDSWPSSPAFYRPVVPLRGCTTRPSPY